MCRSSKGSQGASKRKRVEDANGATIGTGQIAKFRILCSVPQLQLQVKKEEDDHVIVLPLNVVPIKAEADAVHPPTKRRRVQDQVQVQTVQREDQQRNVRLQGRLTLQLLVHNLLAMLEEVRKTALRTARVLQDVQEAEESDVELLMTEAAHAHEEAMAQLIEAESVWTMVVAAAVQNGGHMHDLRMALGLGGMLLGTLALHYSVETLLDAAETEVLEGTATIEEGRPNKEVYDYRAVWSWMVVTSSLERSKASRKRKLRTDDAIDIILGRSKYIEPRSEAHVKDEEDLGIVVPFNIDPVKIEEKMRPELEVVERVPAKRRKVRFATNNLTRPPASWLLCSLLLRS
ncbi:hypothetical protein EDD15DRAFT_2382196 [Pisolithus albus]|nr:hypothetical protein EDD15DRAFT_2382196 [Pisolithus albus]